MGRADVVISQYCISVGFLCIILYMYGFFPIKKSTNMFSSKGDFPLSLEGLKFHKEKLYNGSIGKTVLMVIDGLRVDFVTADNMPYTAAVLEKNGCQVTARVSAPTVTLPRIKAIVTGTVSSFIDVVLNFGTVELAADNIIHQAVQTKTVVFYGDDTWIKLFPRHFTRSDGTSSFFVNDYTEVDSNVSRHLDEELVRSDWDLMVLHYLGLDHIGHIEGPKSPLVKPKLREMDEIIARLHTYLQKQDRGVLVVCGDHGMKDSGSHGGVSLPEVLVPVVVLGLTCPAHFKEEILQVDLAATLSVLWGAPIPADNIGVAAAGLLEHLPPAQRLYTWLYNAQQLSGNFLQQGGSPLHEGYLNFEEAKRLHYEWLTNISTVSHHQVEAQYQTSLISMSRFLSEVLANYDMVALFSAIVILTQVVCMLGLRLACGYTPLLLHTPTVLVLSAVIGGTLVIISNVNARLSVNHWPLVISVTCLLIISFNTTVLVIQLKSASANLKTGLFTTKLSWHGLLLVGTVLFCISQFSSSLIEEEHQLWYWLWATVATLRLTEHPVRWFCVLVAHRFLRTINQTGDKWAHLPDLSDWLSTPHNRLLLSGLCLFGLATTCWCCIRLTVNRLSISLSVFATLCIYLYKAAVQQVLIFTFPLSASGIPEARFCWMLLCLVLILGRSLDSLLICWMLVSCLLLRPYNTLLVPSLFLVSRAVSLPPSTIITATVLHHWLGAVFFFYQGNSNSLASVDLAAGYVGLEEYNIVVVAALLFAHTYSMPIMAYLLNVYAIANRNKHWRLDVGRSGELVVFLQLLHVLACLAVITLHRYHLFVWTVFSPKLLYVAAQTFVYLLLISFTNICIYCSNVQRVYVF